MWTKHISEMTWEDISRICPICDARMDETPCYYGRSECPKGHFMVSAGNYHCDFFVNGEYVAKTDDCFNDEAYRTLEKVIPEARKKYQDAKEIHINN